MVIREKLNTIQRILYPVIEKQGDDIWFEQAADRDIAISGQLDLVTGD